MTLWKLTGPGMWLSATVIFVHGDDEGLAKVYGMTMLEHSGLHESIKKFVLECSGKIRSKDLKIGNVVHLDNGDY